MSTDPNSPATPFVEPPELGYSVSPGLTKREHFASLALQGLLSSSRTGNESQFSLQAVMLADALIAELNKATT